MENAHTPSWSAYTRFTQTQTLALARSLEHIHSFFHIQEYGRQDNTTHYIILENLVGLNFENWTVVKWAPRVSVL